MYIPEHFKVDKKEELQSFIRRHSFGQLISLVNGRLFSTPLPFILEEDDQTLVCHLARQNPQWQEIENQEVLIIFDGSHDYISPSWYAASGVPTWNYQTVHLYGKTKVITDKAKLKTLVEKLTRNHEARFEKSWQPQYSDALLNGIIGMEITITEWQGKYKLNQNRSEQDQKNVIDALSKAGNTELANAMKSKLTD